MSNYPTATTDSAISGLYPIDIPLTINDLLIISIKLHEGYYTGKITLEQIREFFINNTTALEISGLITLLDAKSNTNHKHIASDLTDLASVLASKANATHSHTTSQITGLGSLFESKANLVHTHEINAIGGLLSALQAKAASVHSHEITDVFGLKEKLDNLESWTIAGGSNHSHQISQVVGLTERLDEKANTEHEHVITNVIGLNDELNNKANVEHVHDVSHIENIDTLMSQKADTVHSHQITEVAGIATALGTKADSVHTHLIEDVEGLRDELGGIDRLTNEMEQKSNLDHTHELMSIAGLDETLNGKANRLHDHGIDNVTGLRETLDGKAPTQHNHSIASVDGLELVLNDKSDLSHMHQITDVAGLEETLGTKSDTDHSHTSGDFSDLSDVLREKADVVHAHSIDDVDGLRELADTAETVTNKVNDLESLSDDKYPSVNGVIAGVNTLLATYNFPVLSVNGLHGEVTVDKRSLQLGEVDNTSDLDKPISLATGNELSNKVDRRLDTFDAELTPGRVTTNDDFVTIIQKLQWQIDVLRGILVEPLKNAVQITAVGDLLTFVFEKPVKFRNAPINNRAFAVDALFKDVVKGEFYAGLNKPDVVDYSLIEVGVVDNTLTIQLKPNWIPPSALAELDSIDKGGAGTGIVNHETLLSLKNLISVDGSLTDPLESPVDLTIHTNLSERNIVHDDKVYERAVVLGTWAAVPSYTYVSPSTVMSISLFADMLSVNFTRPVLINGVPLPAYALGGAQLIRDLFEGTIGLTSFAGGLKKEYIETVLQDNGFTIKLLPGFFDAGIFGDIDSVDGATGVQSLPLSLNMDALASIDGEDIVYGSQNNIVLSIYTNISSTVTTHTTDDYLRSTMIGRWDGVVSYLDIPGIAVSDLTGGFNITPVVAVSDLDGAFNE